MGRFNTEIYRRPQYIGGYEPVHKIDDGVYDIDSLHGILKLVCEDGNVIDEIDGLDLHEFLFPFGEALTHCGRNVIPDRFSGDFCHCSPKVENAMMQLRFSGEVVFMKRRWLVDAYYIDDNNKDAETFLDICRRNEISHKIQ